MTRPPGATGGYSSRLGNALNLDYPPYDLPDNYRFNPTLLTALIEANVADMAELFDLPTDWTVSGEETTVPNATIDIHTSDAVCVRATGHWFTRADRIGCTR